MQEFPSCLYIVSLHKLIKILIFHSIHKYRSANCPQWRIWEASETGMQVASSLPRTAQYSTAHGLLGHLLRGDEGFQSCATSNRAAVCNPDRNHVWKNPDRNCQIALPRHCAILHSHQLKFPHSLSNLSVWSRARGSLVWGGPGTAHFPSQVRLSPFLFQHIWMSSRCWELTVQILCVLLRISRRFYVSMLANDLWHRSCKQSDHFSLWCMFYIDEEALENHFLAIFYAFWIWNQLESSAKSIAVRNSPCWIMVPSCCFNFEQKVVYTKYRQCYCEPLNTQLPSSPIAQGILTAHLPGF